MRLLYTFRLDDGNQVVVQEELTMKSLLTLSNVALGPGFSRSSIQTEHFKRNMQRLHTRFS